MKPTLFAILLLASATVHAADRQIMLLQQLLPGHIESVSMVERGEGAFVSAVGMGASTLRKSGVASAEEFAELWALANSPELLIYKPRPDDDGNMADPKFFTVSVGARGKADFVLKIPVEAHNGRAELFISRLKRYIGK